MLIKNQYIKLNFKYMHKKNKNHFLNKGYKLEIDMDNNMLKCREFIRKITFK